MPNGADVSDAGSSQVPTGEAVLTELVHRVAVITLNRPDALNAWNGQLCQELDDAMSWAGASDDVAAVVLTGAGRAFCAGADLSAGGNTFSAGHDRDGDDSTEARTPSVLPWNLPKPVIVAINGHAVGVGATYALACDMRFAANDAKIAFVFSRRGMLSELGSHAVLPRVVGFSNAADLLMSGRPVTGAEAADIGLVTAAVDKEDVLAVALERAQAMATLSAPASMAISKRLLWHGMGLQEMQRLEDPLFDWVAEQPDSVEGVVSFLEKRNPDWTLSPSLDLPEDLLP